MSTHATDLIERSVMTLAQTTVLRMRFIGNLSREKSTFTMYASPAVKMPRISTEPKARQGTPDGQYSSMSE